MDEALKKLKLFLVIGLIFQLLSGCTNSLTDPDDDESEGGVIGTGILLEGTVTDARAFASNSLQIKSSSGEISNAVIDDTGRYNALSVEGEPPYLLRANLGNNEYRYSIAFGKDRTNVHSFTDVMLRYWFAENNLAIDGAFESTSTTTTLPTRQEYEETTGQFFALIDRVLEDYMLTGDQLLTGDYDSGSNDNRIPEFLRNNFMVLTDEEISFLITDPSTEIQSNLKTGYALYDPVTGPDTQPPEMPSDVRSLTASETEIVVVWSPSTDNIGIAYYKVFRDGALIDETPYPVFTDKELDTTRQYDYEIVAVDASGNTSAPTMSKYNGTTDAQDTTAPPTPVGLNVNATPGQMDLTWQVPSSVGDVVRFDVFRGQDNNPPTFLISVTGTLFTDLSIASGTEYCYQIVAVDASENDSDKSAEDCAQAAGEEVANAENLPIPTVPESAGLTIPNIDSIPCEVNWTEYVVTDSTSVSSGCYLASEQISINDGGSLSLAPGVVIKFASGTGIVVNAGGSFSSEGTKAVPVVLTAQDKTRGFWNGINFNQSNSARNKLFNTVVEYAGGGETMAALALSTNTNQLSRVEISGSVIRECRGSGIRAETDFGIINRLDGSVITGCDVPLDVNFNGLSGITQRNTFTGNTNDIIDTREATVNTDVQLIDLGIPYLSTYIDQFSGNLRILHGVEIQFAVDSPTSITAFVSVRGTLTIEGREDNRVLFTGTVKERGHWGGITVSGVANLNYFDLEFAGTSKVSIDPPASLLIANGNVSLSHTSIKNSGSLAIHMYNPDARGTLAIGDGVEFSDNARFIRLGVSQLEKVMPNLGAVVANSMSNDRQVVELITSGITNYNINLLDLGVPYTLTGSAQLDTGSFRIQPGVTLLMDDGAGIIIGSEAYFNAIGTSESPITITHDALLPGAWDSITISSNSNLNQIEHATISYAGGSFDGIPAAVKLDCNPQAMLSIENARIEDSAGWGVALNNRTGCDLTVGDNVEFNRNREGDIRQE